MAIFMIRPKDTSFIVVVIINANGSNIAIQLAGTVMWTTGRSVAGWCR